jgi:hypothetical protein
LFEAFTFALNERIKIHNVAAVVDRGQAGVTDPRLQSS